MANATQGARPGEWLKKELGDPQFSRKDKTLQAGNLKSGSILCEDYGTPTFTVSPQAGNIGNGVLTVNSAGVAAIAGLLKFYTFVCYAAAANAGSFNVYDPDGNYLAKVTAGAGATAIGSHLNVTLADGATDFAVGDVIKARVNAGATAGVKLMNKLTNTGAGNDIFAGILLMDTDASAAPKKAAVVVKDAMIDSSKLTSGDASDLTSLQTLGTFAENGIIEGSAA